MPQPPLADRIALAKQKTQRLVDHTLDLLTLHETNRIVVYSPQLAKQIPQSYAAHAFNSFQQSLYSFALIRLCVFWDECRTDDFDMESIPAVVNLIESVDVMDALQEEARRAHGQVPVFFGMEDHAPELRAEIEASLLAYAENEAIREGQKAGARLATAVRWARRVGASNKLISVRNHRDKNLAHSLAVTRREKRGPVPVPKYGFERGLLWKTVAIVNRLHLGINGSGFVWKESMRIARENAESLWTRCTFDVLR